jgi:hypothetical protein
MAKNESEIWRAHPDFEKLEVSTFGRVRTLKGHCYAIQLNRDGYLYVHFRINGKSFNKKVHRLVAQTFIPNPNILPEVNHKDGNRTNNNVSNIEWCTRSYNRQYREKHGFSQTEVLGQPVFAINLTTLEVSSFRSQREASRVLEISSGSISAVIKGKRKRAGHFWFTNADDNADNIINHKLHEIGENIVNNKQGRETLKL